MAAARGVEGGRVAPRPLGSGTAGKQGGSGLGAVWGGRWVLPATAPSSPAWERGGKALPVGPVCCSRALALPSPAAPSPAGQAGPEVARPYLALVIEGQLYRSTALLPHQRSLTLYNFTRAWLLPVFFCWFFFLSVLTCCGGEMGVVLSSEALHSLCIRQGVLNVAIIL